MYFRSRPSSPALCCWYFILSPQNTPVCSQQLSVIVPFICYLFQLSPKEHYLMMKATLLLLLSAASEGFPSEMLPLGLLYFIPPCYSVCLFCSPSSACHFCLSGFFQIRYSCLHIYVFFHHLNLFFFLQVFPLVKRGIEKSRILRKATHLCVFFFFLIAAARASSKVDLSGQDKNAVLRHSSVCAPCYWVKGQ